MEKETKKLIDFQQRDDKYSYISLCTDEKVLRESAVNFIKATAHELKIEPYALCGYLTGYFLSDKIRDSFQQGTNPIDKDQAMGYQNPGKEE